MLCLCLLRRVCPHSLTLFLRHHNADYLLRVFSMRGRRARTPLVEVLTCRRRRRRPTRHRLSDNLSINCNAPSSVALRKQKNLNPTRYQPTAQINSTAHLFVAFLTLISSSDSGGQVFQSSATQPLPPCSGAHEYAAGIKVYIHLF